MAITGIGLFILFLYIGGVIFIVGALIYLIAKRIKDRQKEDFEKRQN